MADVETDGDRGSICLTLSTSWFEEEALRFEIRKFVVVKRVKSNGWDANPSHGNIRWSRDRSIHNRCVSTCIGEDDRHYPLMGTQRDTFLALHIVFGLRH